MINNIKNNLILLAAGLLIGPGAFAYKNQQTIDIVYTLDLSGSTNGLIDDVRDKMFELTNRLNHLRPVPEVRVGIVAYGRPSFGAKNQYVKVLCPLSTDLDLIAATLYKIKPNIEKGDQYVGAAIKYTVEQMEWSQANNALKIIYLAGNGNVSTGPVDFRRWSEEAKARGIVLHPVYCISSLRNKEITGWEEIAKNSGGQLFEIKIRSRLPDFVMAKDFDRLTELAAKLNNTYIGYGKDGAARQKQATGMLKNIYIAGAGSFEAMLYYQISDRFQCRQDEWDLVDYYFSPRGSLIKIEPKDLPKNLRDYDHISLKAFLQNQKEERQRIVNEIREILPYDRQEKANAFFSQWSEKNKKTLECAVIQSLNNNLSAFIQPAGAITLSATNNVNQSK